MSAEPWPVGPSPTLPDGLAPDLDARSFSEPRSLRNTLLTVACLGRGADRRGAAVLGALHADRHAAAPGSSLDLFTELPPAGFELGGGFGNAIVGTLVMVGDRLR